MKTLKQLIEEMQEDVDVLEHPALGMFLWNLRGSFHADTLVDECLFDQAVRALVSADIPVKNGILETTTSLNYCDATSYLEDIVRESSESLIEAKESPPMDQKITVKEAVAKIKEIYHVNKNEHLRTVLEHIDMCYPNSHTIDSNLFKLAMSCLKSNPGQYSNQTLRSMGNDSEELNELLWTISLQVFSKDEIDAIIQPDSEETSDVQDVQDAEDNEEAAGGLNSSVADLIGEYEASTPELRVFFGLLEGMYNTSTLVSRALFERAVESVRTNPKNASVSALTNTSLGNTEEYIKYVARISYDGPSSASVNTVSDYTEKREKKRAEADAKVSVFETENNTTSEGSNAPPVKNGQIGSVESFRPNKAGASKMPDKIETMSLQKSLQYLRDQKTLDAYDLKEWSSTHAEKYPITMAVTSFVNYLVEILRCDENDIDCVSANLFSSLMDNWRDRYVRDFFRCKPVESMKESDLVQYFMDWESKLDKAEKIKSDTDDIINATGVMTDRGQQYAEELEQKWSEAKESSLSSEEREEAANQILEQLFEETGVSPDDDLITAFSNLDIGHDKSSLDNMLKELVDDLIASDVDQAKDLYKDLDWSISSSSSKLARSFKEALAEALAKEDLLEQGDVDEDDESDDEEEASTKVEPVATIPSSELDIRASLSKQELMDLLQSAIDNGMIEVEMLETLSDDSGIYRLEELSTEDGQRFVLEFKRTQQFTPESRKTSKEEVEKLEKLWDQSPDVRDLM